MSYLEYLKRVMTVFGIAIGCLLIWELRSVLLMTFLSSVIAVALSVPVSRIQQFGISRSSAIAITLIFLFFIAVLFMSWILPILAIQLANIAADLPEAFNQVRDGYADWYATQSDTLRGFLPEFNQDQMAQIISDITAFLSPLAARIGNLLVGVLANFLVVTVIAVFFLIDPKDYTKGVISVIPPAARQRMLEILVQLKLAVVTWITALTFSITITTTLVTLILGGLLNVPNALAIGVIAGVSSIIPNIGASIPLFPITIFTLTDDPRKLLLVIPAYLMIQLLESNVLTPTIVKRELKIPAALVLLFQLVAANFFGFIGVLLAVPLLAIIITLIRELYVYDVLGLRGVSIDIIPERGGGLQLITTQVDTDTQKRVTQTILVTPPAKTAPNAKPVEDGL